MGNHGLEKRELVLYFAYGSNMNPARMRERGAIFYSRQRLILPGYDLVFNKIVKTPNAGAANIVPQENSLVEGTLYRITWEGVYHLDRYEHYPNEYDRVTLSIPIDDRGELEVITYIAHPHKTKEGLRPRRSYLEHLLAADDVLSDAYYNRLLAFETLD